MNALAIESTTMLLVPKNRGLAEQIARALERHAPDDATPCSVRGEDVPYLANELARRGRRVLAFTGDDLVDEWLAAGNSLDPQLERRRVRWDDPEAIYGAPALCLIGRPSFDSAQDDTSEDALGDKGDTRRSALDGTSFIEARVTLSGVEGRPAIRVAVCARYRCLAELFLAGCAGDGNTYELVPIQGSLETTLIHDVADLVIDIVVTGRTIAAAGLRVQRVISTSDLAILESRL